MDIINGLPEYFTEDDEFVQKASEYGVRIYDIRKAPPRNKLHIFSGRISEIKTPGNTCSRNRLCCRKKNDCSLTC